MLTAETKFDCFVRHEIASSTDRLKTTITRYAECHRGGLSRLNVMDCFKVPNNSEQHSQFASSVLRAAYPKAWEEIGWNLGSVSENKEILFPAVAHCLPQRYEHWSGNPAG